MWRNLFILYFVFVKKQRTIERKKKRSKISGLESCYANRIYVLIGVELRPYGQKLVQFCKHTHTRISFSSIDSTKWPYVKTMNTKNTKKSPIHENADANITCDFGDSEISRSRSLFTHTRADASIARLWLDYCFIYF